MTDEVNGGDADMDLNEFETLFFNKAATEAPPEVKAESPVKADEIEADPLATEDDEPEDESDEAEAEEPEKEPEPEPEPEPKPKKKSALQTRIDELVSQAREAERRAEALERRLEATEKAREEKPEKEVSLRDQLPPEAPNPDTMNDKGEPLYPLGEFDPIYIRDLTRFTIQQETKRFKEESEKEAKAREIATEQAKLQEAWAEKVKAKEEEVPDFRERTKELTSAFGNLDPQYGDYLATTIMQLDNGPDILDYLSQNIGEARDIVASGAFAATLAIGRLQAKLEKPKAEAPKREEPSNKNKVSEAPEPPSNRTRGASGKFAASPDTNDLDAFEREFFGKRR